MSNQSPAEKLSFVLRSGAARWALVSDCRRYRYALGRLWNPLASDRRLINWVMLNPSTADGVADDQTLRRVIDFSRRWGYDGLIVTNLFAYRSTLPLGLKTVEDPVGPDNDGFVSAVLDHGSAVVCGWGDNVPHMVDRRVPAFLSSMDGRPYGPLALRLTGSGNPSHPLRLPADLEPFPWVPTISGGVGRAKIDR